MLSDLLLAIAIGFILTLIIMPLNFKICYKFNLLDKPDERKVHTNVKLRGGGISIYTAFFVLMLYIYLTTLQLEILGILLSSLILFVTGILDDRFNMPAKIKLVLQVATAVTAYLFGIKITFIQIFSFYYNFSGILSFVITVFWIVLLINAINLIDGLDGLASGVSIIILATLAIFSQDVYTKIICVFLIGALFGFLKYNFYPSKIFLGDTGSMFLGYIIAVLAIQGLGKTAVGISTIVLMCSFPLLDVVLAIVRRKLNGQPIFSPDKNHIHHCFMKKGYSHKKSVLLIYIVNIVFATIAIISFYTHQNMYLTSFLFLLFICVVIGLIHYLKILPTLQSVFKKQ